MERSGQGSDAQEACSSLRAVLDRTSSYVDMLLAHVDGPHGKPRACAPAKKSTKRKRLALDSAQAFEEEMAKPGTPTQELLPVLAGELRHHQLLGVKYLTSLYTSGLNGIVSDELVDDRLAQAIGMLALLETKGVSGPILVITAASSMPQWAAKLQQLLPGSLAHAYDPARGSRDVVAQLCSQTSYTTRRSLPIVLASYENVVADGALLAKHSFKYIIADASGLEPAHIPQLLESVQALSGTNRPGVLLLTDENPVLGQPLHALWPLLQLVIPQATPALAAAVSQLEAATSLSSSSTGDSPSSSNSCSTRGGAVVTRQQQTTSSKGTVSQVLEDAAKALQGIIGRFVLERKREHVDVSRPCRGVNLALYDLFASCD